MNKESEKFYSSPIENPQQTPVPEKPETFREPTESKFIKDAELALIDLKNKPDKIITAADKRIENIPATIGLDREKAKLIFEQSGFAKKIISIKEQIVSLAQTTKGKIENLVFRHKAKTENFENQSVIIENEDRQKQIERISTASKKLGEQSERLKSIELSPKVGILADANKIENQQIDIIKDPDKTIRVNFKLTEELYSAIKEKYSKNKQSLITYGKGSNQFNLVNCWQKEIDDAIIKISTGETDVDDFVKNKITGELKIEKIKGKIYCALGLVEIILPNKNKTELTPEQISEKINDILSQELEISEGLSLPNTEAENKYKEARYKWHHKNEIVPEDNKKRLIREEVSPGYFTFVEKDKHKEYQQIDSYAIYHKIYSIENLPNIIKAGGLISSHERYKRGLIVDGESSSRDMRTGGGDSVFTRIVTKKGLKNSKKSKQELDGVHFVFEPDLLDRTDWYSYNNDLYGGIDPNIFKQRLSPKELIEEQGLGWRDSNEQMFRTGIPMEKVKAIACATENQALEVIDILHRAGITKINNKSIKQIITIAPGVRNLIEISNKKQSGY